VYLRKIKKVFLKMEFSKGRRFLPKRTIFKKFCQQENDSALFSAMTQRFFGSVDEPDEVRGRTLVDRLPAVLAARQALHPGIDFAKLDSAKNFSDRLSASNCMYIDSFLPNSKNINLLEQICNNE
jgi:hypothetical protein